MKYIAIPVLLLVVTPLFAGDIHGKVTVKGGGDASHTVVYVDEIAGQTFPAPAQHAAMDQKGMKFIPTVLTVIKGTTVDFHNSDAVLHNVFSPDACADHMDLGTWPQGQTKSFTFKKPCFAALLCKVHQEMEGFVAVLPTPYSAIAGADGSYVIKGVPDGTRTVKVWNPRLKGAPKSVDVKGTIEMDFVISK